MCKCGGCVCVCVHLKLKNKIVYIKFKYQIKELQRLKSLFLRTGTRLLCYATDYEIVGVFNQ